MTVDRRIVLVTPNISEQMGGEAIKAHQFLPHLIRSGIAVSVITHQRSASVMAADFPEVETSIVEDTLDQILAWNSVALRPFISSFFFYYARREVKRMLARYPNAVFHYLCPVSPILPRFPITEATNILGPLTGNIYYPPTMREGEPLKQKIARASHYLVQRLLSAGKVDRRLFRRVLVSGGERTRRSLVWAGWPTAMMRDVVDSGISDKFKGMPLIRHNGLNLRFMTSGRLVPHKGVQLTIEALKHVTQDVRFDVYGDGPYGPDLKRLAARLGVADKVRFLGWMQSHDVLLARMADYRGYVVPSLAEANGIVIQEAMMAGLPVICLKWGGPAMLADDRSAILIEPGARDQVVRQIAAALDTLATDSGCANAIAQAAHAIAQSKFLWDHVASQWLDAYDLDAGVKAVKST